MSSSLVAITLLCSLGFAAAATVPIDWVAGFNDIDARAQIATTGDTLEFTWSSSTHNVYSMASQTAFDDCDFTGATDLGSTSPVTQLLSGDGPWFFACQVGSHCSSGQKLMAYCRNDVCEINDDEDGAAAVANSIVILGAASISVALLAL